MIKKLRGVYKRNPAEREQDLIFIAPLLIDGVPRYKIAQILTEERNYTVTADMVKGDTKKLFEAWRKERGNVIDRGKALMIERAEKMWFIACENWEKSKLGKTKTIQKQKKFNGEQNIGKGGKAAKVSGLVFQEQQKHHTESIGDITWYNAMMAAWKLLYDVLDLKGVKKDLKNGDGEDAAPIAVIQLNFNTRSRNNEQFQEAEELDDDEPEENIEIKTLKA